MDAELPGYMPPEIEGGYWLGARKITQSSLWKTRPEDRVMAVFFIAEANHCDTKWNDKYLHREIIIKRGELIRSVNQIAEKNNLSYKTTRTSIRHLIEYGFLEIIPHREYERANAYTHFWVVKYNYYNNPQNYTGKQTDKQGANDGQTTGNRGATNNKDNKDNKDKKDILSSMKNNGIESNGIDKSKKQTLKKKETWLTPYAQLWDKFFEGEFPWGVAAKNFKPLETRHGQEKVLKCFEAYLSDEKTDVHFVSIPRFAQTFSQWGMN